MLGLNAVIENESAYKATGKLCRQLFFSVFFYKKWEEAPGKRKEKRAVNRALPFHVEEKTLEPVTVRGRETLMGIGRSDETEEWKKLHWNEQNEILGFLLSRRKWTKRTLVVETQE